VKIHNRLWDYKKMDVDGEGVATVDDDNKDQRQSL
jgi:hypothetical protein